MGQIIAVDPSFEVEARRISPEEWQVHWPRVSRELDTIEHMWEVYWTKDFINHASLTGGWQVWGFGGINTINIIVMTQVIIYPGSKILQMMLAFGNSLAECAPLIEATMERFAVEMECKYVEIVGRMGWEKYFPRFKRVNVVLRCEVPEMGVH